MAITPMPSPADVDKMWSRYTELQGRDLAGCASAQEQTELKGMDPALTLWNANDALLANGGAGGKTYQDLYNFAQSNPGMDVYGSLQRLAGRDSGRTWTGAQGGAGKTGLYSAIMQDLGYNDPASQQMAGQEQAIQQQLYERAQKEANSGLSPLTMFALGALGMLGGAGLSGAFGGAGAGAGGFAAGDIGAQVLGIDAAQAAALGGQGAAGIGAGAGAGAAGAEALAGVPSYGPVFQQSAINAGMQNMSNLYGMGNLGPMFPGAESQAASLLNNVGGLFNGGVNLSGLNTGAGQSSGTPQAPTAPTGGAQAGQPPAAGGPGQSTGLSQGTQSALGTGGQPPMPPAPPVTPAAPGAASAPSGLGTFVDDIVKQLKDKALSLGLMGASLLMAGNKDNQIPQAAQDMQANTASARGLGEEYINAARSGNLTAPQQASLEEYVNNAKNQVRQYYAGIGQFDSTSRIQAEALIDRTALSMKQQIISQTLDQGLKALGVGNQPLTQIANYQAGQDQALIQAMGQFAAGIGGLFGQGAGQQQGQQNTAVVRPTGT